MRDDYKANRAPMPSDLAEQIAQVHEACEALGVQVLTYTGFEADDVIGTLALRAAAEGRPVAIVTGDKDFFQLVDDSTGVRVFNPRDEGIWYDAAGVKEKFGVAPEQVVDVLALMGDTIDNIKGVPGIGEKGARDLISTHGSLDALLAAAPSLTQKKYREALLAHADSARESRTMLQIRTDVPLPDVAISCFDYVGPNRQKCFELFSKLGFRSLVTEFAPTADTVNADYKVVETEEDLSALVSELAAAKRFALSVIGECPGGMRASLVGIAFSIGGGRARYLPVGHTSLDAPSAITGSSALRALKEVFENPAIGKIGHDLKFDLMMLSHEGIDLAGLDFDTMLASYVLRCDAVEPHDRRGRARTSRLQGADAGGCLRHRAESGCAAASPGRRDPEFRGRARRPGVAARRQARPSACARRDSSRCTESWSCRSSRCSRRSNGTGCGSINRRSRASHSGSRRSWRRGARASSSWRAKSSTSIRRSSCRSSSSTSCSFRPRNEPARRKSRPRRSMSSKTLRSRTSCRS